jgi:hypothetical protein
MFLPAQKKLYYISTSYKYIKKWAAIPFLTLKGSLWSTFFPSILKHWVSVIAQRGCYLSPRSHSKGREMKGRGPRWAGSPSLALWSPLRPGPPLHERTERKDRGLLVLEERQIHSRAKMVRQEGRRFPSPSTSSRGSMLQNPPDGVPQVPPKSSWIIRG